MLKWEHTKVALLRSKPDLQIRIALLLHDIGKPYSYQDGEVRHFKGHPDKSAEMSKEILKRLGYEENEIEECTCTRTYRKKSKKIG